MPFLLRGIGGLGRKWRGCGCGRRQDAVVSPLKTTPVKQQNLVWLTEAVLCLRLVVEEPSLKKGADHLVVGRILAVDLGSAFAVRMAHIEKTVLMVRTVIEERETAAMHKDLVLQLDLPSVEGRPGLVVEHSVLQVRAHICLMLGLSMEVDCRVKRYAERGPVVRSFALAVEEHKCLQRKMSAAAEEVRSSEQCGLQGAECLSVADLVLLLEVEVELGSTLVRTVEVCFDTDWQEERHRCFPWRWGLALLVRTSEVFVPVRQASRSSWFR